MEDYICLYVGGSKLQVTGTGLLQQSEVTTMFFHRCDDMSYVALTWVESYIIMPCLLPPEKIRINDETAGPTYNVQGRTSCYGLLHKHLLEHICI